MSCIAAATMQRLQSTLPRGERPCSTPLGVQVLPRFNPRSHAGSDEEEIWQDKSSWAFQSTLPRGERQQRVPLSPFCHVKKGIEAPLFPRFFLFLGTL